MQGRHAESQDHRGHATLHLILLWLWNLVMGLRVRSTRDTLTPRSDETRRTGTRPRRIPRRERTRQRLNGFVLH
jgi:hypothetical protein